MVKVHLILAGNTLNSHIAFWQRLGRRILAEEVHNVEDCDVTLTFCPIVSRVGTDIEAAIRQIPATRPGVLVALHPTFNPDYVVPDTARFVPRSDLLTANCLFHDGQLLNCYCNDKAIKDVYNYLQGFHREIAIPTPRPNHPRPNHPRPGHSTHATGGRDIERADCLDAVQNPKYIIVGLTALVIVLFVIGFILIMTSV